MNINELISIILINTDTETLIYIISNYKKENATDIKIIFIKIKIK